MDTYGIYDMNHLLPKAITFKIHGRNDGKGFATLLEKDGEWVRYEDVKGLELQVKTLTEQLSKMERRPTENEIIDKIQVLNLKPNDILIIKLNCRISHESKIIMLKGFDETLKKNGFNNGVIIFEDGAELQVIRKNE